MKLEAPECVGMVNTASGRPPPFLHVPEPRSSKCVPSESKTETDGPYSPLSFDVAALISHLQVQLHSLRNDGAFL